MLHQILDLTEATPSCNKESSGDLHVIVELPKYNAPPLIEVVHGVQFRPIPMNITHPGLFFLLVRERYPHAQQVPPLPPTPDPAGPIGSMSFGLRFGGSEELPRSWFISEDDAMLIQLQPDRLLLNWRRGSANAEYPHFEAVADEFSRIYRLFSEFCSTEGLGSIEPTRCEMTYVNHLLDGPNAEQPWRPEEWLRLWSGAPGPEWPRHPDDVSLNLQYRLHPDDGSLPAHMTINAQSVRLPQSKNLTPQVEITVLGRPSEPTEAAVRNFHNLAHQHIVNCFTGITTDQAHIHWGRWR